MRTALSESQALWIHDAEEVRLGDSTSRLLLVRATLAFPTLCHVLAGLVSRRLRSALSDPWSSPKQSEDLQIGM
jgi:hypothetical protein